MAVTYRFDIKPSVDQIIELYENSGLPRPTDDKERIGKMYDHSNLIVSAWDKELLVGISRSITDWVWCCYLADLAIKEDYKGRRIGKKLMELTKEKVGNGTMILLLSVPSAMNFYPKVGMEKVENGFIIHREK